MGSPPVRHNEGQNRYEIEDAGVLAVADYEFVNGRQVFTHTWVPPEHRGRGYAEALVRTALNDARHNGRKVVPSCSYVAKFIERNEEYRSLLADVEPLPAGEEIPTIVYRIDASDCVSLINEGWMRFAQQEGGSSAIEPGRVIGTSLWKAMNDDTSREIYQRFVAKARGGQIVQFNFRCDSPRERRVFRMRIVPCEDSQVEFTTEIIDRQPRPEVAWLRAGPRSQQMVVMCSWCGLVNVPETGWVEMESAIQMHHALQGWDMPSISHGICPTCYVKARAMIDK